MRKRKNSRLLIGNRLLSSVLFLLGFSSYDLDENEKKEVVPMYGMPASIFKSKKKTTELQKESIKQVRNAK